MHIRPPGGPAEPPTGAADPQPSTAPTPVDGVVTFVVPTRVIVAKAAVTVLIALLALFAHNATQLVMGLIAAAGLAVYTLRDVLARERLRADGDGIIAVRGFAGHSRLAWADVEQIRVDARSRLGARTELLEVDAGERIFLYSRFDLGADPDEAAQALDAVRKR